ncbi:MAG: hypothetical protein IKL65_02025 [Bacilli bacterium]|nr:hypothetical protein [Bacilli bacterium]
MKELKELKNKKKKLEKSQEQLANNLLGNINHPYIIIATSIIVCILISILFTKINIFPKITEENELTWTITVLAFFLLPMYSFVIITNVRERLINKKIKKFQQKQMDNKKINIWNKFIEDVCSRNISTLNEIQKNAVLCFWYDCEINNGGHCAYFSTYPHSKFYSEDLFEALKIVGNNKIANNFIKALQNGIDDEYEKVDNAYYQFEPALIDYLEKYVIKNEKEIFSFK